MKTAEIIPFEKAALDAWHKRLDAAHGEAIEGILAFARACHEFQHDCAEKRGGSVYTASMKHWYGIGHPKSSYWATLGAHAPKLSVMTDKLPPSMETLYWLCGIPDNVIRDRVTEKTTQREARALKREHASGKEEKRKAQREKPHEESAVPAFEAVGWLVCLARAFGGDGQLELHRRIRGDKALRKELGALVPEDGMLRSEEQVKALEAGYLTLRDVTARESLRERDEKKIERAIQIELAMLRKGFHEEVRKAAVERAAEMSERLNAEFAKVESEKLAYSAATSGLKVFMTRDEYRLIVNCLHPDRAPEDRRERFTDAFKVMRRLGKIFD